MYGEESLLRIQVSLLRHSHSLKDPCRPVSEAIRSILLIGHLLDPQQKFDLEASAQPFPRPRQPPPRLPCNRSVREVDP